jgi:hypothetical protein
MAPNNNNDAANPPVAAASMVLPGTGPHPNPVTVAIGLPVPVTATTPATPATPSLSPAPLTPAIPTQPQTTFAPAWFYSALNFLLYSYSDGQNVPQAFGANLIGSDVDPYRQLGSTRLFVINYDATVYRLSTAPDIYSSAPVPTAKAPPPYQTYARSDAGILALYQALLSSPIFPFVKFCYIPGNLSGSLNPAPSSASLTSLGVGYDPSSGLRSCVLGTALSQVVPLDDFTNVQNEAVFNQTPTIVPFVTVLVYDVTSNNFVNAQSFVLPTFYTVDLVPVANSTSTLRDEHYVNRLGSSGILVGSGSDFAVYFGQTVVFSTGPAFDDELSTTLVFENVETTTSLSGQTTAPTMTTTTSTTPAPGSQSSSSSGTNPINQTSLYKYNFSTATIATGSMALQSVNTKVQTGISLLSYVFGTSPFAVFSQQKIIGFYRDLSWPSCLGVPMYDFGSQNSNFKLDEISKPMIPPEIIYDPSAPFLNGGGLRAALKKIYGQKYLFPPDQLDITLNSAATFRDPLGIAAGMAVQRAALNFQLNVPPPTPILNQLKVPILVTVRNLKPTPPTPPPNPGIVSGTGTDPPIPTQPWTVQFGLSASIPQEALDGTGITAVGIETRFPQYSFNQTSLGNLFRPNGTVVNLNSQETQSNTGIPPFVLSISQSTFNFMNKVYYVLSLTSSTLSVRGSDGSSGTVAIAVRPPSGSTYLGALVYDASVTAVTLYPKLQLSVPLPSTASQGLLPNTKYSVRFTHGNTNSSYDIFDPSQALIASDVSISNDQLTLVAGSTPVQNDLYFGSFVAGSTSMTLWSVPLFLTLSGEQLPGFNDGGQLILETVSSGLPTHQLQITDSSLLVFSDINVDTHMVGSLSINNVFLAIAAINSAPDDASGKAYSPNRVVTGIVRQIEITSSSTFGFIPEDDSIIIGGVRYMLSVISLTDTVDILSLQNPLPYPPMYWPSSQYWQFSNKHNPYLDVKYTGESQEDRVQEARANAKTIGLQMAQNSEPMHLFLNTRAGSTPVCPIFPFPFSSTTNTVDVPRLSAIQVTILSFISKKLVVQPVFQPGDLDKEQINRPNSLALNNPYVDPSEPVPSSRIHTARSALLTNPTQAIKSNIAGLEVSNLSPNTILQTTPKTIEALKSVQTKQAQTSLANLAVDKSTNPVPSVTQKLESIKTRVASPPSNNQGQPIYGFSIGNPSTGEVYIVEVVLSHDSIQKEVAPQTVSPGYDPYYVRVMSLSTRTAYNMSILVPSMLYDQNNSPALQGVTYKNAVSKTDELQIGYMRSTSHDPHDYDSLTLSPYPPVAPSPVDRLLWEGLNLAQINVNLLGSLSPSQITVFTNAPYSYGQVTTASTTSVNSASSSVCFICRRQNWKSECHLMQAKNQPGSMAYYAFGDGDIVPLRLTPPAPFNIDKRLPAYNRELTYTFTDQKYTSTKTITVSNVPYVVATFTVGNSVQYNAFSMNATSGTVSPQTTASSVLTFPNDCYVVGQASTTLTPVPNTTSSLSGVQSGGSPQFQLVTYNDLVYLIRAVSNSSSLGTVGGLGIFSGLLIDTYVPSVNGNLVLAKAARHKRSRLPFFGSMYTPTTMVESLDNLDYTSITGDTFYASTIFIPIPELDATRGFIADLSSFVGQQVWTFIYPEIVAQPGATVNGVPYAEGYNIDTNSKPILSLQKLHFVYDSLVVMFTPNDLTHKYTLQPKQRILALTNDQIREGISWRTAANENTKRDPPQNICVQQILPEGFGIDRPNIIYSPHNRPLTTSTSSGYLGMSVHGLLSVSGATYNVEERNFTAKMSGPPVDQSGSKYMATVSSNTNILIGVLFDYDNNDLGTMTTYDPTTSTKGVVLLNGYQSSSGYTFASGDHFDVNDVLKSEIPLLGEVSNILGLDQSFFNIDLSLPKQYWSLTYDSLTPLGALNYVANVPPALIDPNFVNRTRSLILSLQNRQDPVQPTDLGLADTHSSVVSVNLRLQNGITGSIYLNKTADREVASLSSPPPNTLSVSIFGLPPNYDFFVFSRDHYSTVDNAMLQIIDNGYAMCLVDDGTGTGNKVAKYYVDSDGNYFESYSYVLASTDSGILESSNFALKVTLGSPANLSATPALPETPNNVSPQDMVNAINKASNIVYAAFGPTSSGQPPAFLPIQAVGTQPQALPIMGPPGFNGYSLNVMATNRQPMQVSNIYSGSTAYPIAGSTTVQPIAKSKPVPFYGSISHGIDSQVQVFKQLRSSDGLSFNPRGATPPPGVFGGAGTGALIGTIFSQCFQGSAAIPPTASGSLAAGSTMKADDSVFYTYNAATSTIVDSTGKSGTIGAGQYFVDDTDTQNLIYGVITLPSFSFNSNAYVININTAASDGTSRYTLIVGGKSFLFDQGNKSVTVDQTRFTFNPVKNGAYIVTYTATNSPIGNVSPSPTIIMLSPFTIVAGGLVGGMVVDVFNNPGQLKNMILGIAGRQYTYDPLVPAVTVTQGSSEIKAVKPGSVFASSSGYGYVMQFLGGSFTFNGAAAFQYSASQSAQPVPYSLLTSPKMFTLSGNYFTFDQDTSGNYVSVTGNNQIYVVNPYQFSILGEVYIFNTQITPNTVTSGGQTYKMTTSNTQFNTGDSQYTLSLLNNSLNGAMVSGQFNISQANVIVIENYVYQLDTLNGRIVGNGTTYPLISDGVTYTISSTGVTDNSFTVTTEPNATTVTIDNVVYSIRNSTVVGDGITYRILPYRTFLDGTQSFSIEFDGTVSSTTSFTLSGNSPYSRSTFTDGSISYTVNDVASFDGSQYHLISGSPPQFSTSNVAYTIRRDGVSVGAGANPTYIVNATGSLDSNQFTFGSKTIAYGRASDYAAFDGKNYFAIVNGQFTDTSTASTYTISGNTAVSQGSSYEIFSNLGQGPYFQVPDGPTYYVNISVADTGSASGDSYNVFPISGGQFTIPLVYAFTISGSSVSVSSFTLSGGTKISTLTANGGSLTGGYFQDPVTKITYNCVINYPNVTFVDSNNGIYQYSSGNNSFVAEVLVSTGVLLAVDNSTTHGVYPIHNNQFTVNPTTTYNINVSVAYTNSAKGPYWPIVNGRFIVPNTAPISNIVYTIRGGNVTKGYAINQDDQFSVDGNVVYTVDAVNVVKATNKATLTGTAPNQTLTAGSLEYTLNSSTSVATIDLSDPSFALAAQQFTVSYSGGTLVTYNIGNGVVTDSRQPTNTFIYHSSHQLIVFKDSISNITFSIDRRFNHITAEFVYVSGFFTDPIAGLTYYVDGPDAKVEGISYLPETTQYAFVAGNGQTYLIHYSDVGVVFPVISGEHVNVGVATVGSAKLSIHADSVDSSKGGTSITTNKNSIEINGNLYSIYGTAKGSDYSNCMVVGHKIAPKQFTSKNTFTLTDPSVTYTLQLDANNLPIAVQADFVIKPSQDFFVVNDNVYIITYNSTTSGSLLGQGQSSLAISNSSFTLSNNFDSTQAKFIFADLNIYDAASVVGQFSVYTNPTFVIGTTTYTIDTVNLLVSSDSKQLYPLISNPMMFSINGSNYVIDTNSVPHTIVGNSNSSPLSTDVTVQSGKPIANSTFTLNGMVYKYTEDVLQNLLTVTGTQSYMISSNLTFQLGSGLPFTITIGAPAVGSFPGSISPIGTVTAGVATLYIFSGKPESGNADYFTYKNVMYTLIKSKSVYESVQRSYTIYAAHPSPVQQQLAVFNMAGTTYMVTDGTLPGASKPAGINPGTLWAATSSSSSETQFGLVYGFGVQPLNISQSTTPPNNFQFQVSDSSGNVTLYDVLYVSKSANNNVQIDIPSVLPCFAQRFNFTSFCQASPLVFETGGYNAFSTSVDETAQPLQSFSAAYSTAVLSTDPQLDSLITAQGDFSIEFWHSTPLVTPAPTSYHPVTYNSSVTTSATGHPIYFIDVNLLTPTDVYLKINETLMYTKSAAPISSSRWRHLALTYTQPYVMMCTGAGFEVNQNTSNLNLLQDFTIAMTFSVEDVNTTQGLLYKGTGSAQNVSMSYRVAISGGSVTLQFTDGHGNVSSTFIGPTVTARTPYRVIISKSRDTPLSATNQDSTGATDPYLFSIDSQNISTASAKAGVNQTDGTTTISSVKQGLSDSAMNFINNLGSTSNSTYTVVIAIQKVNSDGTFGQLVFQPTPYINQNATDDIGLTVNNTGTSPLWIGNAFYDNGQPFSLGSSGFTSGNISEVYIFNSAINPRKFDLAIATSDSLHVAAVIGYWKAAYDPNGIVQNGVDSKAVAVSNNASQAYLAPQAGREMEGTKLYLNGYEMTLTSPNFIPAEMSHQIGSSSLIFNRNNLGIYKISEISIWNACRQPYQVINDMFGKLVVSNEPTLALYLSSAFTISNYAAPLLPTSGYIDQVAVRNPTGLLPLQFSTTSISFGLCPPLARCGPLVAPNLYTPPGVASAVADTIPSITTYSMTTNSLTSGLAGELNEAYVYISDQVLTLYAGKKVGDLVLSWVSQEQGDVQLIGYIEGAPPAPMANLTVKPSYLGATSITLSNATSAAFNYGQETTPNTDISLTSNWKPVKVGGKIEEQLAPFGFGITLDSVKGNVQNSLSTESIFSIGSSNQPTSSNKLDTSNKYTVKLEGSLAPITNDLFMSSLNTLTTPSTTGSSASKAAILPSPNLGGFTVSNPPAALPSKVQTDEKFGSSVFIPSPYGQAFVTSTLLDVYQQTLRQSGTIYGYIRVPNSQVPPDLNIVPFRMSSKYIRPGCLDGVVGYTFNPATLPGGATSYSTSTGEMQVLNDKNFSQASIGHDASYMKLVETYQLKKQIDQESFGALALYNSAYQSQSDPSSSTLTPSLDFYNEYIWNSRGGSQEVKHTYSTTFDQVYTTSFGTSAGGSIGTEIDFTVGNVGIINLALAIKTSHKQTIKETYRTTSTSSFDITASFDGIENDTQMRYASNNDAHFIMQNNSIFNTSNQSGLNLVTGSDGRVFNIVPSVSSGAGIPLSDNIDDALTYSQPQPSYSTGNSDGLTGTLEPYDRPGKTSSFRSYAFFLQPSENNADNFWNTVVDQTWLANSPDADAIALREANSQGTVSIPWRILYRVTDSERFLPPTSSNSQTVPSISPVMAVPVTNAVTDFLFMDIKNTGSRPPNNPSNDTDANVVLVAPSASGLSVGSTPTSGQFAGTTILSNNIIPFDLVNLTNKPIVNWGDTTNTVLLSQVLNSVLGLNVVTMSTYVTPGSTKNIDILDLTTGVVVYSIYTDPNGYVVNIPTNASFTVYQDVNGNPIQYYNGKTYHSLQANYIASPDGTLMLYIQSPPKYDQSAFELTGDYDLFGHPGDEWRYYYVSGCSSDMTSSDSISGTGPFRSPTGKPSSFTGFTIPSAQHSRAGNVMQNQVAGYVMCKGLMQWANLNTNAETLADVSVYKAMSLFDIFPIGDVGTMVAFLKAQYPSAPFVMQQTENDVISLVFAKNIFSYFNTAQQLL